MSSTDGSSDVYSYPVARSCCLDPQCVRLTNEQFAMFFPEFDEFHHQVLTIDMLHSASNERGYIAFGCADGYAWVLSVRDACGFPNKLFASRQVCARLPGPLARRVRHWTAGVS
jgi:hypothetical protein